MHAMNTTGGNLDRRNDKGESQGNSVSSVAQHLGTWVANLAFDDIPEKVRQIARRCVMDTMAVSAAGTQTHVSQTMRTHAATVYGSGNCSVIGEARRLSMPGAALANGVAAHALDFDDTSYAGVVHGSAIVLPALLAAAEQGDINGAQFLTAFVAGSEVIYALGLTMSDHHYLKGWWATSTLGAIGAAAGAAKALGLGQEKTSRAIALAAVQANGMSVLFGSDAKPLIAGQAARLGVEAALLADAGISGPETVFEDPRGFLALMNEGIKNPDGLRELGQTWRLLDPGIAIKRMPVCSAAQAAIEATQYLIASNGLDAAQIKTVMCHVPHLVKISLIHEQPATASQAQFSMPFAVGCILALGILGPSQINRKTLANKEVQEAMSKITMVEGDELNGPTFQPHFPECTRVTLTMSTGQSFTHLTKAATGMPSNPLSDEALSEKFKSCMAFADWSAKRAHTLRDNLEKIDELTSIRSLFQGET